MFAVVFLKALMQAPIARPSLTYFWLGPAIVLFLPPLGRAGVDSDANEAPPPLQPTSPGRAERGAGAAALLRAGAQRGEPAAAAGPCRRGLLGLMVFERQCSPPRPS